MKEILQILSKKLKNKDHPQTPLYPKDLAKLIDDAIVEYNSPKVYSNKISN